MKKVIAVLVTAILVLTVFAACSNKENNENTTAGSANNTTVSAENKETQPENTNSDKVLTMGTNATFPPYEYYAGEKIIGIDAEVAALIAEKLGMTLEIKDMDFNGILAAVDSGVVDIGMAGMTIKPDRLEQVNFTNTYAKGVQVVIVKEGSDIKSIDDLAGKKIGVQETTTGDSYATEDFGEDAVKRYNKGTDAVAALMNGTVDAVIIDNEPAKAFVAGTEGLKILDTKYADEDYAIAVKKENTELLEKINNALDELTQDGSIKRILDKYINSNSAKADNN